MIEISSDSSSDASNEVTLHSSTESPVKAIIQESTGILEFGTRWRLVACTVARTQ